MSMPVVCAWCGVEITPGNSEEPASHGICDKCANEIFDYQPERKPQMKLIRSKVYFAHREGKKDDVLVVVGVYNDTHNYSGDYYANEYYYLPETFNPVGLTLAQLDNHIAAWDIYKDRNLDTDLQEDR